MLEYLLRLVCAFFLGLVMARISNAYQSRIAFGLITMGTVFVCLISMEYLHKYTVFTITDPGRLAAQVVAIVGFIGTGLFIMGENGHIWTLSSAAAMWVCAVMGILIGVGLMKYALITVLLVYLVFYISDALGKKGSGSKNQN